MTLAPGDGTILAIDPSSKAVGWAVRELGGISSGAWNVGLSRSTGDERHRELCGRASFWLADMITEYGPEVLVIESGIVRRSSDRCLERLRGALFAVAWTREVATVCVQPRTWQSWADKNLPLFVKSDEADARGILAWFLANRAHRIERPAA